MRFFLLRKRFIQGIDSDTKLIYVFIKTNVNHMPCWFLTILVNPKVSQECSLRKYPCLLTSFWNTNKIWIVMSPYGIDYVNHFHVLLGHANMKSACISKMSLNVSFILCNLVYDSYCIANEWIHLSLDSLYGW